MNLFDRHRLSLVIVVVFLGFAGTLAPAAEPTTKPVVLKKGGTAESPAVWDGKGMVIDLGVDVTDRPWTKAGDLWTSTTALYGPTPVAPGQFTGLFIDETPITFAFDSAAERADPDKKHRHFKSPEALKPGQMGCTEEGLIYFRWPTTKDQAKSRVIALPKANTSAITIACSYITVRNVTVMHASNDGFNIHGDWVGIRLENVKAISNADEGISAHETVQMDVDGAEIAWNGSFDAGVADVDQSSTTYVNCIVHDNVGAAFKFVGKSHSASKTKIYHQAKDFTIGKETTFHQDQIEFKPEKE